MSWSPSCRCCAPRSKAIRPRSRASWRGGWSPPVCRTPGVFVTPMAAVAGAVADDGAGGDAGGRAQLDPRLRQRRRRHRALPGTGRALHRWARRRSRSGPAIVATASIEAAAPVRGIATSGRGGRSFSLGIADAVTVLAADAAAADVAATLIANAVDHRQPRASSAGRRAISSRTATSVRCRWWLRSVPSPSMMSQPRWTRERRKRSGCARVG